MPQFTLGQKKAHDHQRHISITANAGSGKTSVLVSRYCDLLELRGYQPGEVAAITFTEKAAAELRSRIAREIESRLDDPDHQETWDRLKEIREKFPASVVTTIHGFCGQILREFPIDLEISPTYSVISGYERTEMEEASLMEAIEKALRDDPEGRFDGAYDTVRRIGREQAEGILRLMLRERESIALMESEEGILQRDSEETLALWFRQIDRAVRSTTLNAETRPALETLLGFLKPEVRTESESDLDRAERAATIDEYLGHISSLFSRLLTKGGTPRKSNYVKDHLGSEHLLETASILSDALKRAESFLAADGGVEVHETLLRDSAQLRAIASEARALYRERKERIGGLDFEDLQLTLYYGLQEEEICERIAGRFRYIMVDEFQDTNQLQYQIVREMAQRLQGPDLVCLVGDRKQSIYGFRGAEVEVFADATEEFRRVNRDKKRGEYPLLYRDEEIEPDSREEALGEIALNASFRLLPGICAYVNAACSPVMRQRGAGVGVEYEPLVCARQSEGKGIVEMILATEPDEDSTDEPPPSEATLIVRRIQGLVLGGEDVVWDRSPGADGETARAATYGDIAILCRKRSTFEEIERECRAQGVPYLTHGSSGYFATQEVYDVVNYLRTLLNYRNDVALLGLLRSPFFAVSDAELYRISRSRNLAGSGHDLWERTTARVDRGEASDALSRAITILRDDQAMASRVPVSLMLKRIVERTGWRGAVIGSDRGPQALANVDKLIDLARDFERRGFTNLFDFVERVSAQIDLEEMESEAEINSSRDAVRLMTMHGAKGLEFPIVFLPALHSPPRRSTPPFLDKELGFGWNWTFNGVEHRPAVTVLMEGRSRDRETAEEARLFYVALTRARDMLVLSGVVKESPTEGTMLAWGLDPVRQDVDGGDRLEVQHLDFLAEDGRSTNGVAWSQPVKILRDIPPVDRPASETETFELNRNHMQIGEIPARARGEIYSATQFLLYTQCPTRYYLRYRLGIPEQIGEAWDPEEENRESEDGTTVARIFRTALRSIDEISSEEIPYLVDRLLTLEALDDTGRERARARALRLLENITATDRLDQIFRIGTEKRRVALELRIPLPYDRAREYIVGVIDRVIPTESGISFFQFKTLQLRGRSAEEIAESYRPQMRLYAWLLSKLYPDDRSFIGTVIFADKPSVYHQFPFSRFDLLRAEEEFRSIVEDIRSITYTARRDLPLSTPHCPICPYFVEERCLLAHGTEES